jgi:hypothetical protein
VRFDILDHHPYATGGPTETALNVDDVAVRDLRKLTRPLRVAQRAGNVTPRRARSIWVTELSWDSRPPDPDGVPAATQARWLEGAFYVLWRQGVDAVTWFRLRDETKKNGYAFTYQSGVYLLGDTIADDRPKPSFTAFRFPFTAYRSGGSARLWGVAPARGRVRVERRRGRRWVKVKTLRAGRDRVFHGRLRVRRGVLLRARQRGEASLSWRSR